jgi:hypothetical protein
MTTCQGSLHDRSSVSPADRLCQAHAPYRPRSTQLIIACFAGKTAEHEPKNAAQVIPRVMLSLGIPLVQGSAAARCSADATVCNVASKACRLAVG